MPPLFQADPDAVCEHCGAHGAFRFDGETLCAECYAGRGSCCSTEFSGRAAPVEPVEPKNPKPAPPENPPPEESAPNTCL